MKPGDLLFVYGTLRRGQSASLAGNSGAEFVGEDKINGWIYNLGWYPGVKTEPGHFSSGAPTVAGDVFKILDETTAVGLDGYEGYPSLYNRIETETADGRHVWVYTYNHPVSGEDLIVSGDWRIPNVLKTPEVSQTIPTTDYL